MDNDASLPYNIPFAQNESMFYLRNYLFTEWEETYHHHGAWREKFTIPLAVLLTRYGFCTTFNIIEPNELLHLDKFDIILKFY